MQWFCSHLAAAASLKEEGRWQSRDTARGCGRGTQGPNPAWQPLPGWESHLEGVWHPSPDCTEHRDKPGTASSRKWTNKNTPPKNTTHIRNKHWEPHAWGESSLRRNKAFPSSNPKPGAAARHWIFPVSGILRTEAAGFGRSARLLYPLSSILYPGPRSDSRPDAAPCPRSAAAQPRSPRAFPGLSRALPEPSRHFPSITTSRLSGFSPKQGRKRKSSSNPLSPLSLPLLISLPCTCPFRHGLSKLCGKIKLSRRSPPHHATIPDIPNCSQKTPLLLCTLLRQKHPQNPLRVASSPICPLTNAHQRKS